jgi:hypothetical protein
MASVLRFGVGRLPATVTGLDSSLTLALPRSVTPCDTTVLP